MYPTSPHKTFELNILFYARKGGKRGNASNCLRQGEKGWDHIHLCVRAYMYNIHCILYAGWFLLRQHETICFKIKLLWVWLDLLLMYMYNIYVYMYICVCIYIYIYERSFFDLKFCCESAAWSRFRVQVFMQEIRDIRSFSPKCILPTDSIIHLIQLISTYIYAGLIAN